MKKIIMMIVVAIVLCAVMPAFAAKGGITNASIDDSMLFEVKQFDGIYITKDGMYSMQDVEGEYLPVGKYDVDLTSEESVAEALKNVKLSEEVKQEIREKSERVLLEDDLNMVCCTIFSPDLIEEDILSSEQNEINATKSTKYKTYNGVKMKSDLMYTYKLNTSWKTIKSGAKTSTVANDLTNFLLLVLSKSKTISLVSTGKTVLDYFIDKVGSSYITGSTKDFLQMRLIYDEVKQWTYKEYTPNSNDWRLGLCTQKVTLSQIGIEQYYYNATTRTGKTVKTDKASSVVFQSPSFNDPWAKAYKWAATEGETEWITWKVKGKTFHF